jgi:hypothetical protein
VSAERSQSDGQKRRERAGDKEEAVHWVNLTEQTNDRNRKRRDRSLSTLKASHDSRKDA